MEVAKHEIATPYPKLPFVPIEDNILDAVFGMLPPQPTILDFGCGVGRNIPSFLKHSSLVYAYDFPNMHDLAQKHLSEPVWQQVHWVKPPLSNLATQKYDLAVAILVLQHLSLNQLQDSLQVIQEQLNPNGLFFVQSRVNTDEGRIVWDSVLDHFKTVPCDFNKNFNPKNLEDDNHQNVILCPLKT